MNDNFMQEDPNRRWQRRYICPPWQRELHGKPPGGYKILELVEQHEEGQRKLWEQTRPIKDIPDDEMMSALCRAGSDKERDAITAEMSRRMEASGMN